MSFELVLVGGGLQNALIALAVLERRPHTAVALVERGVTLGGNHTWSFHAADVPAGLEAVFEPLVAARWPAYHVRFPGLQRRIARPYATMTSERVHAAVTERFARAANARLFLGPGAEAVRVEAERVTLADGTRLTAPLVVDARGPGKMEGEVGFQKFLGLEFELAEPPPGAANEPVMMDATVEQLDGYRFVYTLPLSPTRVLVEDTYYSDDARLDLPVLRARVRDYAERAGLRISHVVREETGVLPLPLRWSERELPVHGPLVGGYAGGWFHPTTGYSVPCAARFAQVIAGAFDDDDDTGSIQRVRRQVSQLWGEHVRQVKFFTRLNAMLFRAFPLDQRWRPLERFHRMPEDTVERFYALQTTAADRARILFGRPPRGVQLGRALRELVR